MVGVNLITGLPPIDRYDAIVVYIDHFSKQVHTIPTTLEVNMEGIADIHYCQVPGVAKIGFLFSVASTTHHSNFKLYILTE